MISSYCILHYYENEEFDRNKIGENIKISKNRKCVTFSNKNGRFNANVFGTISISSRSYVKCKWDFLIKDKEIEDILIGVSPNFDLTGVNKTVYDQDGPHYLYYSGGKKYNNRSLGKLPLICSYELWQSYGIID